MKYEYSQRLNQLVVDVFFYITKHEVFSLTISLDEYLTNEMSLDISNDKSKILLTKLKMDFQNKLIENGLYIIETNPLIICKSKK